MTAIFKAHKDCQKPRTVLIEGDPGMGKTAYCQKLAYDWATKQDEWDESFPETDVLLLLRCRDIKSSHSSIKDAIDDQILPSDVNKEAKEVFFQFIRENQLKVLLVLDGVDEVDASKLIMIENLVRSKEFANCHIVLTSRHEDRNEVPLQCDTLWEIVGFTERDAERFIRNFFLNIGKVELADKLLDQLKSASKKHVFEHEDEDESDPSCSSDSSDSYSSDSLDGYSSGSSDSYSSDSSDADRNVSSDLKQLTKNPLHTALICTLFQDFKGILPDNRTQLYNEIVLFLLRRYEEKNGFPSNVENLISVYKEKLIYLGRMAFQALCKGEFDFEESEADPKLSSLLIKFGFLTIQEGSSMRGPCRRCGFFHKSFQEFFSGFYLAFEISDEDIHYLVTDERYLDELEEVFLFLTGIAASQGEETAVSFVSRVASYVNKFVDESDFAINPYLSFALDYTSECTTHRKDLRSRLVDKLGKKLNIKQLAVTYTPDDASTKLFYEVVGANSSLTNLDLTKNRIGYTGAESLSKALKVNSSLINLNLSKNIIGYTDVESLSQALKVNSSLTDLDLSENRIGDTHTASFSKALRVNSSLTNLNLSENSIGDTGAESLSQALKVNSSLTNLNLNWNGIGHSGAKSLSQALKGNSSLTYLNLSHNSIGDTGVAFLSQAIKEKSSLTDLHLSANSIDSAGAESISQALTANSSLINLDLSWNSIGDNGAESLSQALIENSFLADLDLSGCRIGNPGAESLSRVLEVNSSLTNLNLSDNSIGGTGAAFLYQALTVKSSLTNLDLSGNSIGDTVAESLSQALKVNSSLTNLDLSGNSIGDTGAESLSQALKENSSLTYLDLSRNSIGDTGTKSLSLALKINSSLTNLNLSDNSIGDTGAESLFQALIENSSLTTLDSRDNRIGRSGADTLSDVSKVNKTVKILI